MIRDHRFFDILSGIPRSFFLVFIVFLAFVSPSWAQSSENRIQRIQVEGNRHIDRQAIIGTLSIQAGNP
jgi:outer membrane protein assembly factor BamA